MEKATPQVNKANVEKKKYAKPELTQHKPLREITMAAVRQSNCSTCTRVSAQCV